MELGFLVSHGESGHEELSCTQLSTDNEQNECITGSSQQSTI